MANKNNNNLRAQLQQLHRPSIEPRCPGRIQANRVSGHKRKTHGATEFSPRCFLSPNGFSSSASPHFPIPTLNSPDFLVRVAILLLYYYRHTPTPTLPHDGLKSSRHGLPAWGP